MNIKHEIIEALHNYRCVGEKDTNIICNIVFFESGK